MRPTLILLLLVAAPAHADRFSAGAGGFWGNNTVSQPSGGSSVFAGPGVELGIRFEVGQPKSTGVVDAIGLSGSYLISSESNVGSGLSGEKLKTSGFSLGADVRFRWLTLGAEWRSITLSSNGTGGQSAKATVAGFGPRAGIMIRVKKRFLVHPYFALHSLSAGPEQSFSGSTQQIGSWRAGLMIYLRLVGNKTAAAD